eukprot:764425-Hanusia_phi.AAC.4
MTDATRLFWSCRSLDALCGGCVLDSLLTCWYLGIRFCHVLLRILNALLPACGLLEALLTDDMAASHVHR